MVFPVVLSGKSSLRALLCMVLFVASGSANANFICSGKVLSLGSDNSLFVNNGYGVHRMCSLSEDRCKAWLSIVMAAKMADRSINIYYQNNTGLTSSHCASVGNWVDPTATPVYFIDMY